MSGQCPGDEGAPALQDAEGVAALLDGQAELDPALGDDVDARRLLPRVGEANLRREVPHVRPQQQLRPSPPRARPPRPAMRPPGPFCDQS